MSVGGGRDVDSAKVVGRRQIVFVFTIFCAIKTTYAKIMMLYNDALNGHGSQLALRDMRHQQCIVNLT